jgi:hypothetical protein
MTDLPHRRTVRPFPDDDPLSYGELTREMRALRALLAVLADTGAAVAFPGLLSPGYVPVEVAAGWRLDARFNADPDDANSVVLSATWMDAPLPPGVRP